MTFLVFLAAVLMVAHRCTTAAERQRLLAQLRRELAGVVDRSLRQLGPYRQTLRERTKWAPVTPAMVACNLVVFAGMVVGAGPLGDPETLVAWGGNVGPLTANGEWWRLVTALFAHPSLLHLAVGLVALVPLGFVLERLVGPVAFAAVYVVSGVFSGLFHLSAFPVGVAAGSAGAIAGLYGLMVAAALWGVARRPMLTIPRPVLKCLAATAALFVTHEWAAGTLAVVVVGFASGLLPGLMVASCVNVGRTPAVRLAATVPVMLSIAVATAVPLAGITDARSDLEAVVAFEDRSSAAFRTALQSFTEGRTSAAALADVIDRRIRPELRDVHARIQSLSGVPAEQQPRTAAADEYLRLRAESWELRVQALRSRRMKGLASADAKEAAALEALRRVRREK